MPPPTCHHIEHATTSAAGAKSKALEILDRQVGSVGSGAGLQALHKECQVLVRCPRRCDVRRMLNWLPRGEQEVGELTGCPVLWGVQRTEQTLTHARLFLSLSHTPSLAVPLCVCYKNNERLCWRGWQLCWPIAIAYLCIRIKQFTISDSPLWYFYF